MKHFSIGTNYVVNACGPIVFIFTNELHINSTGVNFVLIMILTTLIIARSFGIGWEMVDRKLIVKDGTENNGDREARKPPSTVYSRRTFFFLPGVRCGIFTSLVQLNTFALFALSISKKGWKKFFSNKVVKRLWIIWFLAPVFTFFLSYLLTMISDHAGLLHYW